MNNDTKVASVARRAGGVFYTSVENIHKVIDPLFLDGLTRRVDDALAAGAATAKARRTLDALQNELASLTFLDPACGSGNFLTETYLSLRRLENRLIAARQNGQGELDLGQSVRVTLAQFHGIEIDGASVAVAKTAMRAAEAQMQEETASILCCEPECLPLRGEAIIIEGDALRIDWPRTDYIMGNPPFVSKNGQSMAQKAEVANLFSFRNIDYAACWFAKASDLIQGTRTHCAFVFTNSITQGEQVSPLWRRLAVTVDFAWRSFCWVGDDANAAHVHVCIIGFHAKGMPGDASPRTIYDGDRVLPAQNINAYLLDAPDIAVSPRPRPLCNVPRMIQGNMPLDGGALIIEDGERANFLAKEPGAAPFLKRLVGSKEFINNLPRWCLWMKDVPPDKIRALPLVMSRVAKCRENRLASRCAATRKHAATPALFRETNNPKTAVIVPCVSSERREYVPMGFVDDSIIVTDRAFLVPDGTLYHFGVLTSSVHMAWMRGVCGRLEMSCRYSATIVYNNFLWPEGADEASITGTAQAILDVRARYPDASLADLYDPLTMPPDLRAAHRANDKAVLAAYGLRPDTPEDGIVKYLLQLCKTRMKGKRNEEEAHD